MSHTRYRQLAIVTTVGICVLVVAGGAVRLTGSGLGCDDWPNCNDERFIDVSTGHAAIEQLNRLLSGLIGLPTLLLAIAAFRVAPRGAGYRWPAVGVLVSVLANGVVGGIAVRRDLHPALVQSHFLLAMISIAFGMVAIRRSAGRRITLPSRSVLTPVQAGSGLMVVLTAAALVTGTIVTGTGPHAGEEDVRRFGFDISNVARLHSLTVLVTIAVAAGLSVVLARSTRSVHRELQPTMSSWLFVGLLQGAIGYAQYFAGVPELLVGAHIATATLLWVITCRIGLDSVSIAESDRDLTQAESGSDVFRLSHGPVV